jgi:hypothetical protein
MSVNIHNNINEEAQWRSASPHFAQYSNKANNHHRALVRRNSAGTVRLQQCFALFNMENPEAVAR